MDAQEEKYLKMTTPPVEKLICRLAVPCIVSMLVTAFYNMADTYFVGMLKSNSGLYVNYGITSEGVIDVGYTGSIVVKLYNHSCYDYKVNAGDKISQLVITNIVTPPLEVVETLDETERGDNGFGSSGR